MQPIRLAELDLQPILTEAGIVRMPALSFQGLIDEAMADPDPADMYMRMFHLLHVLGQHEFALSMQANALERRSLYRVAGASASAVRLLALMAPGDVRNNAPLDYLVEDGAVRLDLLYLSPEQPLPDAIPDHDVAIVAIRESGSNRPLLAYAESLLAGWPRPVLNRPQHVPHCAREEISRRLQDVPGLLVPQTRRLERGQAHAVCFPATIRPLDTHSGNGLAKIASQNELDAWLAGHADDEFHVAGYIDYRSADGLFRKYRIALIDGSPYLCHLAIAEDWMVHYASAGMQLDERKRAEEAQAMREFDGGFAVRHRAAWAAIAERLALDYVILDCAEMGDGRLLLFEADTGGWIHATDPADVFPYKRAAMQKAFGAFHEMLVRRAGRRAG